MRAPNAPTGGSDLGLTFVKGFVEAHGGQFSPSHAAILITARRYHTLSHPVVKPSTVALVIDDEPQMRRLLRMTLEANGYEVFDTANGQEGIAQAAQRRPEIILLDLGLPDLDGVEVLKRIREWSRVPVIILSVRDSEHDKIAALDAGADDFVTKPFGSGELLARLRTTLRRSQPQSAEALFRSGNLEVDLSMRTIRKNGMEVKLTPTEYALLRLLVVHVGKVLTHRQILTEVWGPNAVEQTHYLRVHIAHLREKLEDNASQPKFIITEPAVGYRAVRLDDFINQTVVSERRTVLHAPARNTGRLRVGHHPVRSNNSS